MGKSTSLRVEPFLAKEIKLPLPVVAACFQIYESKGYGVCSAEIGAVIYCGND